MTTTQEQQIRDQVAKDYAAAVTRENPTGCCGSVEQKGVAVKIAGYTKDELGSLPDDAVVNAFGCGNPTAFSNVKEGDVVLDLGSGAGIDLLLAAKKVGSTGRVIGIDMTDEMIERAQANIDAAGASNVEVRKGLIEAMPVEDASVDWVISNCVINLSPEKPKVFAEIARVLKPGGHMLVSDIVVQELPAWVRENTSLYSGCIAGAINEEDYIAGLVAAGLTDVEVLDRIVYTSGQLEVFATSELKGEGCGCVSGVDEGASDLSDEQIKSISTELASKVWSANFTARKPD